MTDETIPPESSPSGTRPPSESEAARAGADGPALPGCLGRYRVIRILGDGVFGIVYLADDPELDRQVAIKVPKIEKFRSQEAVANLLVEARRAAKLRHPGIVTIYDVGADEDGRPYVVMEYIQGSTLRDLIDTCELSPPECSTLVASVAEALGHAHAKGFVHRDLKPSNILVDQQRCPHIADFGLSLHEHEQQQHAGEVSGTPAYMSPEQVRGDTQYLDGRTDIWSLGVILYELLSKRRPFHGSNRHQLFEEITQRDPKPPRQIDPAIPEALERTCLKALSKTVSARYSTAGDMAKDLRAVRTQPHPREGEPRTLVEQPHRELAARLSWGRSGCSVALTFVALLFVGVNVLLIYSLQSRYPSRTPIALRPPGSDNRFIKAIETADRLDALAEAGTKSHGADPPPTDPAPPLWRDYATVSEDVQRLLEVIGEFPDPSRPEIELKTPEEITAHLDKVTAVADTVHIEKVQQLVHDYLARLEAARQQAVDRKEDDKARLLELIEQGLPEVKRTADEGYQEAFTIADHVRLVGTFRLAGANWYRYWPRGKDVQDEEESLVFFGQSITEPQLPLTVRAVQRYTEARQRLVSRINDRAGWEEFLATCEQLSAELSRRYEGAIDVSFEDEISVTKEVLASWDDVEDSFSSGESGIRNP